MAYRNLFLEKGKPTFDRYFPKLHIAVTFIILLYIKIVEINKKSFLVMLLVLDSFEFSFLGKGYLSFYQGCSSPKKEVGEGHTILIADEF